MKERRQSPDKNIKSPEAAYRKGKIGSWKEDFSNQEQYIFQTIAGDLLMELGYANDSWWYEHQYQRVILPFSYKTIELKRRIINAT